MIKRIDKMIKKYKNLYNLSDKFFCEEDGKFSKYIHRKNYYQDILSDLEELKKLAEKKK
jgi:hypothetical protein